MSGSPMLGRFIPNEFKTSTSMLAELAPGSLGLPDSVVTASNTSISNPKASRSRLMSWDRASLSSSSAAFAAGIDNASTIAVAVPTPTTRAPIDRNFPGALSDLTKLRQNVESSEKRITSSSLTAHTYYRDELHLATSLPIQER